MVRMIDIDLFCKCLIFWSFLSSLPLCISCHHLLLDSSFVLVVFECFLFALTFLKCLIYCSHGHALHCVECSHLDHNFGFSKQIVPGTTSEWPARSAYCRTRCPARGKYLFQALLSQRSVSLMGCPEVVSRSKTHGGETGLKMSVWM